MYKNSTNKFFLTLNFKQLNLDEIRRRIIFNNEVIHEIKNGYIVPCMPTEDLWVILFMIYLQDIFLCVYFVCFFRIIEKPQINPFKEPKRKG